MITISETAEQYLKKLAQKEENKLKSLRLTVVDDDTPYAEANLDFVEIGPEHVNDMAKSFDGFTVFIDSRFARYLDQASIESQKNNLADTLLITTPNLKPATLLADDANLEERVHYFLEAEVNPELAGHGGNVRLVEISDEGECRVAFGGGCQGCSMISMTMKHGVEKELLAAFPTLTAVVDVTDHSLGQRPFY